MKHVLDIWARRWRDARAPVFQCSPKVTFLCSDLGPHPTLLDHRTVESVSSIPQHQRISVLHPPQRPITTTMRSAVPLPPLRPISVRLVVHPGRRPRHAAGAGSDIHPDPTRHAAELWRRVPSTHWRRRPMTRRRRRAVRQGRVLVLHGVAAGGGGCRAGAGTGAVRWGGCVVSGARGRRRHELLLLRLLPRPRPPSPAAAAPALAAAAGHAHRIVKRRRDTPAGAVRAAGATAFSAAALGRRRPRSCLQRRRPILLTFPPPLALGLHFAPLCRQIP